MRGDSNSRASQYFSVSGSSPRPPRHLEFRSSHSAISLSGPPGDAALLSASSPAPGHTLFAHSPRKSAARDEPRKLTMTHASPNERRRTRFLEKCCLTALPDRCENKTESPSATPFNSIGGSSSNDTAPRISSLLLKFQFLCFIPIQKCPCQLSCAIKYSPLST